MIHNDYLPADQLVIISHCTVLVGSYSRANVDNVPRLYIRLSATLHGSHHAALRIGCESSLAVVLCRDSVVRHLQAVSKP